MAVIRAQADTTAPREVVWQLVRNVSERLRFLPPEAFRDVEGDADHARFEVRVAKGWARAEARIVRVVEGEEVEEHASADGLVYVARFQLVERRLAATVDYQLAGIPGFLERTLVRPRIERSFGDGLRALTAEAEGRAAG